MPRAVLLAPLLALCACASVAHPSPAASAGDPSPAEPAAEAPRAEAEAPPGPTPTAAPPAVIAQLQIFGSRYPGSPACFRWIADLRGRTYESQPDAIDVELSSGDRMSIPFVASEADTYISSCVPIARLGDGERITARFRAELAGAPVDETQVFLRAAPADDGFVDIPGAVVPAAP